MRYLDSDSGLRQQVSKLATPLQEQIKRTAASEKNPRFGVSFRSKMAVKAICF